MNYLGLSTFCKGAKAAAFAMAASAALSAATPASAEYPDGDIRMVIPFGVGGGSDTLARTIVGVIDELKLLPVSIYPENRPGGSGAIGYTFVAGEKGNPNVVATVSVSFFTTPLRGASPVSYKDFTPLAAISISPYIMAVAKDSPIQSLDDVKAAGRLTTATVGVVSDPALLAALTSKALDVKIDAVPFDGEGEAMAAVLGGHLDFVFMNPSEILPQIETGAMRAIAVSTADRIAALPETPTFTELGYDIEHTQLRGLVMPADVPPEVVAYWEDILKQVAASDEWRTQYIDRYLDEPAFLTSAEYQKKIEETNERYKALMEELGLR